MSFVYINEELIKRDRARVDIEDRGYQFGDGIYEVIEINAGRPIFLKEHLDRFVESAKKIHLNLPYNLSTIKGKLLELVNLNEIYEGIIYLQLTRGVSPRNHIFLNQDIKPNFLAYTKNFDVSSYSQEHGVKVTLDEDIRWMRCDIKSLNLLPNVLLKQKAAENGSFEAILHRDNIVTEGSSTNLFIIKNEILYTHPANNLILNGITRQKVIELCQKLNLKLIERPFSIDMLVNADEIFITGTKIDIIPVIKINNYDVGNNKRGCITEKIQKAFELCKVKETV